MRRRLKKWEKIFEKALKISAQRILVINDGFWLNVYLCYNPHMLQCPAKATTMEKFHQKVVDALLHQAIYGAYIVYKYNGDFDIYKDLCDDWAYLLI